MRKIEGSRSNASTMASRSASRNVTTRGSGIHVLGDRLRRRERRLLGKLDGVLDLRLDVVVERSELLGAGDAERLHALAEDVDRIALHILLHLFLAALLGRVGHRVDARAVRRGLDD